MRVKRAFTKQISAFFSVIIPLRLPGRARREVFLTSCRLFRTSPGVDKTSPGLVLSTQGLVRNSRRLVKHTSRRVRLGRRNGIITLKNANIFGECLFTRAYIYVFYFPKKVFTHSHNARFLLIFSCFECEGFDFKVFTGAAKPSHGR